MAKMSLFSETFNGNVINAGVWGGQFGTLTVSSGALNVVVNSGAGNYSGMNTNAVYDLTGSACTSCMISCGNQSLASFEAYPLQLAPDASNGVQFLITLNTIYCRKKVATVNTQVGSTVAYDPNVHKYFRIREQDGTTYWDYSTDGNTWTNQTSTANPITMTALQVLPTAGTFGAEASGTSMIVDNFNVTYNKRFNNQGLRPAPFKPGLAR